MIQEVNITPVFLKNYNANTRLVVNQGGSGSSKTYSICQVMLAKAISEYNATIDFMRESTPALTRSVMEDWKDVLYKSKLKFNHHKTDNVFTIEKTGSKVSFYGLDDPQKIRGRRRHYGFIDEANEAKYDAFKQIIMRTRRQLFLSFNPSDEFHWIYDKALTRDDCTFIQSTYKDNPYLEPEVIVEIERLKDEDENYWRIFGLGERGISKEIIYNNWRIGELDFEPNNVFYGLDFGFQVQTALDRISTREKKAFIQELIYETHVTNTDLIQRMRTLGIKSSDPIYADNAEPDRIKEIHDAGFNIHPANKSVKAGIDHVKSWELIIDKNAVGTLKEIKNYKNKTDKNGNIIDEPVKFMDHSMDAIRYGMYTDFMRTKFNFFQIGFQNYSGTL